MCVSHWARAAGFLLLLGLLSTAVGCGGSYKNRGKVKGTVVFFDKHLTAGTVTFQTEDGRIGSGNIDFNGNYTVSDAPVGSCKVTVSAPKVANAPAALRNAAKPPPGMPPMQAPGGGGAEDTSTLIDPSKIVQIPGKYASPDTSNLTFTVERGEQTYNITLTP
jgi:hypothetical protein